MMQVAVEPALLRWARERAELAYRRCSLCECKNRAAEALAYNGLVQSFPEIAFFASDSAKPRAEQTALFEESAEPTAE